MSIEDDAAEFSVDGAADAAFRAEVRAWLQENAPDALGNRAYRVPPDELKPWHRKLYERGWIAPHWPTEYGGMGASIASQIILFEEMARLGVPSPYPHGLSFIGPLLIAVGTPAQKATHLPPILTGEATWCQGYSEANAGSDLASLRMRADLDGDVFVVNGHKMWTTNGHYADWMFALVRTDPDAPRKHAGISLLLIDLRSPGVTVRPIRSIKGDEEFAEEFFDDVRVPRENLVGGLNDGWRLANMVLANERFITAHPRHAMETLSRAGRAAEASGATDDPAFRDRLARLHIDVLAYAALYRHAAALDDAGRFPDPMGSIMRLLSGETVQRAADLAVEAAGSGGASAGAPGASDLPVDVAALFFEGRRGSIGSGTSEIQRQILARRVLGLPR